MKVPGCQSACWPVAASAACAAACARPPPGASSCSRRAQTRPAPLPQMRSPAGPLPVALLCWPPLRQLHVTFTLRALCLHCQVTFLAQRCQCLLPGSPAPLPALGRILLLTRINIGFRLIQLLSSRGIRLQVLLLLRSPAGCCCSCCTAHAAQTWWLIVNPVHTVHALGRPVTVALSSMAN